ncbi:MAG: group 1 truncated hemoglobin [Myxococcales bacterium]|nr:group 1 truncated hemoglobin [Myxococcales bacterium]
MALFDQIGEAGLRAVLVDFYDRVFADPMIGFFFLGKDKARLVELELQHTARMLGERVAYDGRPMREAHAPHRIMKGQFLRRNRLLEQVLADHRVPGAVVEAWLAHARGLEAAITGRVSPLDHCVEPGQARPAEVTDHGS